ncbi:EAL domain-containing protein [Idiomarina seosinensis]|uniref:sensor domain-containing protein n=1 Tax=Idiomarina seosinensis TaxID=281739 RepID=UPI00384E9546
MFEKVAALTPGAFYRFEIDINGQTRFTQLGQRIECFTGVAREDILADANNWFKLVDPAYEAELQRLIKDSYEQLTEFYCVFPIITHSHQRVWLEARSSPEKSNDGVVVWTGFVYEVTERETANQELKDYTKTAYHILDNILDAIFTTDSNGVILFANTAASKLLGYTQQQLLGNNVNMIMSPYHRQNHDGYMQRYKQTGQSHIIGRTRTFEVVDKAGVNIPIELRICEFQQEGEQRFMGTLRDLRSKLETEREIINLRNTDTMTGLLNRAALLVELNTLLDGLVSEKSGCHALICLDIDDFHLINEGFGVDVGDKVLTIMAQRLASLADAKVARVHEDEFALLVQNVADESKIHELFNQAKQLLEQPLKLADKQLSFRLSGGAYLINSADNTALELLHNSQSALGMSKAHCRGQLTLYESGISADYKSSALIDQKLKSPSLTSELFLMFQPQYQSGGSVVGYEALVRWQSGDKLIPPDDFIPIAERNGIILQIGDWLLEQACDFIEWMAEQPAHEHARLSINISPVQFQQANFVDDILNTLTRRNINPKRLHLELTEQLLVENTDTVAAKMTALNAVGITFSLDDFGTGYSSLSYLSRLPLSEVKIDKSFIRDLAANTANHQIVEAIMLLSLGLGLNVIAEGVETLDELELLSSMGCVYYQGYYFKRPQRLEDLS